MAERDFKGVWIPREVWLDDRLNALDKVILVEIDSLDQGKQGCYASNEHLAEFCQCSQRKVSEAVSRLIKYGYIYVQGFDGRKRTLRSCLATIAVQPSKICEADTQKVRESNTGINTANKPKRKREGYGEIVQGFTEDLDLQATIWDFIEMRRAMKSPMTEKGLKLLLSKLGKLSSDTKTQIAILDQSIERNWKSVFPLKDNYGGNVGPNGVRIKPESEQDHILDGIL